MAKNKQCGLILVGNSGGGWFPPLSDDLLISKPESWGNRKISAIREYRKETGADYATALSAVENKFPEFKGRWIDRQ